MNADEILTQKFKTQSGREIQIRTGLALQNNPSRHVDYELALKAYNALRKDTRTSAAPGNNLRSRSSRNKVSKKQLVSDFIKQNDSRHTVDVNESFKRQFGVDLIDTMGDWIDIFDEDIQITNFEILESVPYYVYTPKEIKQITKGIEQQVDKLTNALIQIATKLGYIYPNAPTPKLLVSYDGDITLPNTKFWQMSDNPVTKKLIDKLEALIRPNVEKTKPPITTYRCNIEGSTKSGEVFEMSRDIDVHKHEVYHTRLFLPSSWQNKGYVKKQFAAALPVYDKLKIVKIELDANSEVGGYAWARYGAIPDLNTWESLSFNLRDSLTIDHDYYASKFSNAEINATNILLNAQNPKSIWALAALPLGRVLLLGTEWVGKFDIKKGAESRKQLERYIGYEKQKTA